MRAILFLITILLSACASNTQTSFKTPQVMIKAELGEIKTEIIKNCLGADGKIEENTNTQILCSGSMGDNFDSTIYGVIDIPHEHDPTKTDGKVLYRLSKAKDGVYVFMDMYVEFQTTLGQTNKKEIEDSNLAFKAQNYLNKMKDDIENNEK